MDEMVFKPAEEYVIQDVAVLKALANPQRLELLRLFETPQTVKQVAQKLAADPTKLYYHVKQMEKHGLIKIVATHVVSGIIEKQYQVSARHFRLEESLTAAGSLNESEANDVIMTVFDSAKQHIRQAIRIKNANTDETAVPDQIEVSSQGVHLTDEQHTQLIAQLTELSKQLSAWDAENEETAVSEYGLTFALYPIVSEK